MKFWKMNGAGNDFIILNNMDEHLHHDAFPAIARTLCERHLSIGADGMMVVEWPSEGVDAAYGEITDAMYAHGDVTMFMDPTLYRTFIKEANAVCCANHDMLDAASDYITYPGDSRVILRPTAGLAGTEKIVVTWAKNLVFGTDVEGSENDYKVWYDDKDEMTRFKVLFNAGVQVKFPDQAAIITVSAA